MISYSLVLFYIIAAIAVISALMVVSVKSIMHSALFLALSLFSVSIIFILANADFLAVVQILLYTGGITVLMLFAILLTQKVMGKLPKQTNEQKSTAILLCVILGIILISAIKGTSFKTAVYDIYAKGTTGIIGKLLLTKYVLPFEIASVILLVAMIGVIAIAKKEEQ